MSRRIFVLFAMLHHLSLSLSLSLFRVFLANHPWSHEPRESDGDCDGKSEEEILLQWGRA